MRCVQTSPCCQERQRTNHDHHTKERSLVKGDTVFVKSFGEHPAWLAGSIVDILSSLSMQVKLTDGRVVRRHLDHVHVRFTSFQTKKRWRRRMTYFSQADPDEQQLPELAVPQLPAKLAPIQPSLPAMVQSATPGACRTQERTVTQPNIELRRSTRARKPYPIKEGRV